jgi:hypothetical protein
MTYKDLLMTPVTNTDARTGILRFRSCVWVNWLAAIQCKISPMTWHRRLRFESGSVHGADQLSVVVHMEYQLDAVAGGIFEK